MDGSKRPALVRDVLFDDKGKRTDVKLYADASPWAWRIARRVGRVRVSRSIFARFAATFSGGLLVESVWHAPGFPVGERQTLSRWIREVGRIVPSHARRVADVMRGYRPARLSGLED